MVTLNYFSRSAALQAAFLKMLKWTPFITAGTGAKRLFSMIIFGQVCVTGVLIQVKCKYRHTISTPRFPFKSSWMVMDDAAVLRLFPLVKLNILK